MTVPELNNATSVDTLSSEISRISQYPGEGTARDVYISGSYAYIADDYAGLEIIDISDLTNPIIVSQIHDGWDAYGVTVRGSYAYVADYGGGLEIIDISDPYNPVEIGQFDDGGYAYVVNCY